MYNFTTSDFLIDNGVITGLTAEGRIKIKDNKGVIDSFPDDATFIGNGAFANVGVTTIKDWGKITKIGDYAFSDNQIAELPDNWGEITNIGDSAFRRNQITTLPDNWGKITSIGNHTFSGNQINGIPEKIGTYQR